MTFKPSEHLRAKKCVACKKSYEPRSGAQRRCSACRALRRHVAKEPPKPRWIMCVECDTWFKPRAKTGVRCSEACRNKAKAKRRQKMEATDEPVTATWDPAKVTAALRKMTANESETGVFDPVSAGKYIDKCGAFPERF